MADEKKPSDERELLLINPDKLDIVLGTLALSGKDLQVLYVDGTEKKCQAKITLGSALKATVAIPLNEGNARIINSQIAERGLSREDVKKIIEKYGIRKGTELMLQGHTKEELLEGKVAEKKEGKEKE